MVAKHARNAATRGNNSPGFAGSVCLAFAIATLIATLLPAMAAEDPAPLAAELITQAERLLAQGDMTGARELLDKAVASHPAPPRALYLLGQLEYTAGRWAEAADLLERAARTVPGDFDIRFLLGALIAQSDHREQALAHLEAANRLRPDHPDAAKLLAIEYNHRLGSRNAVRVLRPFLDPKLRDEEAYLLALDAYHKAGDRKQSRLAAETAVRLFPDSGKILGWMGQQYAASAEYPLAKEFLERAIRLEPDDHAAYYVMGTVLLKENQYQEALRYFQLGLERKPDHGEARAGIGRVLLALGQTGEALTELERARELLPEDPAVRLELSKLYLRLGDSKRARAESAEFMRLKQKAGESGSAVTVVQ